MNFIEEYKETLNNALQNGDLVAARQLVQGFHATRQPYDAELCYLEAVLCYYEYRYPLALFWAEMGYQKAPDFTPIHELLGFLTTPMQDYSLYKPSNRFDCSLMNRPLRIVIFEGVQPIVDYNAEQFRINFEALGHTVMIFRADEFEKSTKALLSFIKQGIDFCLLFNNVGTGLSLSDGRNAWEAMNIPCFNYLFDHPIYYFDTLDTIAPTCVVTCVDRNHVHYIKRFYPKVKHSFFFPLAGEEIPVSSPIPWEERSIDVLYVGSLKVYPKEQDAFDCKITAYLCEHTDKTVEEAIEDCFRSLSEQDLAILFPAFAGKISPEDADEATLKKVLQDYRFCDTNTNSIFRKNTVKQLVDAGIHVTVYGRDWLNTELSESPYFHFGGYISQADCLVKMQDSKIVLNSMPWFKDGTHDRIYNAMLAHAVCVTDSSKYLTEQYINSKDIVYYSLDEMEKLPVLVKELLSNPDKAKQIAENGYQKTVLNHTWQNRAMELLNRVFHKNFDE